MAEVIAETAKDGSIYHLGCNQISATSKTITQKVVSLDFGAGICSN